MPLSPAELKEAVQGLLSFPVTPFTAEGKPDLARYRRHLSYMLSHKPGALFVCGGTGEFFSLSLEEYRSLVTTAVEEVAGAVPVIAGVGYGTALAIEFSQVAQECGADGVMVMPPYLLIPEQSGLEAHYRSLAEAIDIGIVLYQRDNAIFHPDTVARLAEVPNIVGFKDGYGDMERLIRAKLATGDRLFFINGMPTAELSAQAFRGAGVQDYSSAVFNFVPEIAKAFYQALTTDDHRKMSELLEGFYLPFARLRDQVKGYAVSLVKKGVSMRHGEVGGVRAPLVDPTDEATQELRRITEQGLALVNASL